MKRYYVTSYRRGKTHSAPRGNDTGVVKVAEVECREYSASANGEQGLIDTKIHAGLTAGTTQTQADGLELQASFNEVSVCATALDTVILPLAVSGRICKVVNNGAKNLQVFPAVSDDLGAGVDLAMIITPNNSCVFRAIDAVTWHVEGRTETPHAGMYDTDNTDAFVMVVADNEQCYHSNGVAAAGLLGWTFDAGGAGTSFPIASVADGAAPGVDLEITTTGSHGLAVGDIVSHANLTDADYEGIYVVKAIISDTEYEVLNGEFTSTDTGTMEQAATLNCIAGNQGNYVLDWSGTISPLTNSEECNLNFYLGATAITGGKARHSCETTALSPQHIAGNIPPFAVAAGDRLCMTILNQDTAGNFLFRNLSIALRRV